MYNVGDLIKVEVTGIESYGIFVKTDKDYTGLIHISEMDVNFVSDINKYAAVGDIIYSKIMEVNDEKKHLSLSIKNLNYHNNQLYGESITSFSPLYDALPKWVEEYKNKNSN